MKRSRFSAASATLAVVLAFWCTCLPADALIEVARGNKPVRNMGWPLGCEDVANLSGRLGHTGGPQLGRSQFFFQYPPAPELKDVPTARFNEALKIFAAIQVPMSLPGWTTLRGGEVARRAEAHGLELAVHDGPEYCSRFSPPGQVPEKLRVDWTFTVYNPESWHRAYNQPMAVLGDHPSFRQPVPPPRIDVYIGGGGSIVWEDVKVPSNVRVIDRRAESAPVRPVGGGLVRGAVYDMATGQPIKGAQIVLARRKENREWEEVARGETDSQGCGEVRKVPAGRYQIRFRAEGYAARKQGSYDNKGETYHEFAVELMREAGIKGAVTDSNGKPIPGVRVSARDSLGIDGRGYACVDAKGETTDEQGRFEVRSLAQGYTRIRCRAASLHQATSILELYKVPSDEITIVMTGTGTVRGRVIRPDGRPAGGVHVHLHPPGRSRVGQWGGSVKCKEDGSFEFKGWPPGEYLVSADLGLMIEGNDPNAVSVTVKAYETVEVEVTTERVRPRTRRAQDPPD